MELERVVRTKRLLSRNVLLIIGIIFVAFNLRPAITAVGPLISSIRADLGISNGVAGFITTLPLLSFALFSFFAPKFGKKYGNEKLVFIGLLVLALGIIIRSTGFLFTLFIGTAMIGIGIAVGNVLLPSIVKSNFPEKVGLLTGLYTLSMNVFAGMGTGLSVPLAENLHLGWRNSLLSWAFITLCAILIWCPQIKKHTKNVNILNDTKISLWRSSIAWQVTIFMGLQSLLFYCSIAWFPEILIANGISNTLSGWMVSIMQLVGVPFAFLTPILATHLKKQISIVLAIGISYFIGLFILLFTSNVFLLFLSVILIGIAQGAVISLSLTLLSLRASNSEEAGQLSGMAQSFGYGLAAIGPTLIGVVFDFTNNWILPISLLLIVVIIMSAFGIGAGRDRRVFE